NHRRGVVAAQTQAVERLRNPETLRVARHQPDRARLVGFDRLARPDVRGRVAGGRDEALLSGEPDVLTVALGRAERRPEVAARSLLRECERRQVLARRDLLANVLRPVL